MSDRSALTTIDPPRNKLSAMLPMPLILGLIFGTLIVYIGTELPGRWAFYIFAATVGCVALPFLFRLVGRVDRLFTAIFIFGMQFLLGFNLMNEDRGMPGGVQGLTISLQLVTAIAYFVTWRTRPRGIDDDDLRTLHKPFVTACLIFYACLLPSFFTTLTRTYTIYGLFYHASLLIVAFAGCHICSSRSGLRILWRCVCAMLIVQPIICLVQRELGINFTLTGEVMDSPWGERVGGTLGAAPSNVATFLMGMLLFAEIRLMRGTQRDLVIWTPAFGLGILSLLLSLTRSAWIGWGIGTVFVMGWIFRRGGVARKRWMAFAALILVGLVAAWGPVRQRMDANHEHAAEERWLLNYINLEMIKDHPIVGIGLNTAYDAKNFYIPSFFTDDDWVYIAHNQYLLVAAETGMIGLFGFLRILWISIWAARAGARSRDRLIGETGIVLFAYLIGFCWGMNLDFYGGNQIYTVLWFIFGCAAGVEVLARREEAEQAAAASADQAVASADPAVALAAPAAAGT